MTIQKRLFIYFMLVSVIPVLLVGGISYYLAFANISDNAVKSNLSVTERVASDVGKLMDSCYNTANLLEDSISDQEAMRRSYDNVDDLYSTELRISMNMYVEAKYQPDIFGLYMIGDNGSAFKSSFCTLQSDKLNDSELYSSAFVKDEMEYLGTFTGSQVVSSLDYPMLAFGKAYKDKATGKKCGVIILEIEREKFENLLSFDISSEEYMVMVDSSGTPLASVGNGQLFAEYTELFGKDAVKQEDKASVYARSPVVIKAPVTGTDFSVIRIVPSSEIIKEAQYIALVISLLCAALIIAALLFSWSMSHKVTGPIKKLVALMHQVEAGDLTVSFTPKYNDEISTLFKSFNVMVEKVNTLMISIQDEQQKLRASEMRALMSQINPHFLYNTLDSIVWLCRAGKTQEAAVMTDALASFFRIGLSKGRDVITVGEELKHAENYLKIQGIRGGDTFDYEIDADASLTGYSMIKFVLQPLVENAIYHGIYALRRKGHIAINVYAEDENIVLGVTDTGAGMTPPAAARLRAALEAQDIKNVESYGLVNVNRRVRSFFGDAYGIRFFSVYGKGSSFEIVIPRYMEGQDV